LHNFIHVAKVGIYRSGLFKMTSAAMTPGTQPHSHSKNVIKIDPHPLSNTAKGGQIMDSKTRQILITLFFDLGVTIGHGFSKNVT
jgi:hypothetical protein